jgi:hypothetical protein
LDEFVDRWDGTQLRASKESHVPATIHERVKVDAVDFWQRQEHLHQEAAQRLEEARTELRLRQEG